MISNNLCFVYFTWCVKEAFRLILWNISLFFHCFWYELIGRPNSLNHSVKSGGIPYLDYSMADTRSRGGNSNISCCTLWTYICTISYAFCFLLFLINPHNWNARNTSRERNGVQKYSFRRSNLYPFSFQFHPRKGRCFIASVVSIFFQPAICLLLQEQNLTFVTCSRISSANCCLP